MDIYEILKGVPVGTKLYTPMCGKVAFTYLASSKETIGTKDKYGPRYFDKNGRWMEGGEVMLFPSDKMRDWSKFAWKKGDVLVSKKEGAHIIFEKFTDDTYTIFAGKYYYCKDGKKGYTYLRECDNAITEEFQYEIENEKFVTDQAFDLRISVHEELRDATEGESVTFHEACTLWENQEKKSKEQPCFKPFDKVLVRSGRGFNWYPALFVRDRGENSARRYTALPIHIGTAADFTQCIPYEGHENFAFTDYDFVDLPF